MTDSLIAEVESVRQKMKGGMVPAVPVPRYKDGRIHTEAQTAYAAYLSKMHICGVAVWSHTGRGLHLSEEERFDIFRAWKSTLPKDKLIIAGAGAKFDSCLSFDKRAAEWRREAIEMARQAVDLGSDALLVFPPVIYRELPSVARDRHIVEYHGELAELGLPLVLFYLYEAGGGMEYTDEVLKELLSLSSTVGIKMASLDSVMSLQQVSTLVSKEFPDRLLITGEDRMFGYSLMRGANSSLMGLGAAYPNIQHALINSYRDQDYERFMELSLRIDNYAEATFTEPMDKYILRMLWCLVCAGVIPREAAYDIAGHEMSEEEIEKLRDTIQRNRLY
ncbi:putative 2-keto-3-deoxy-galactonate aldolase YagE [compost metagenome]